MVSGECRRYAWSFPARSRKEVLPGMWHFFCVGTARVKTGSKGGSEKPGRAPHAQVRGEKRRESLIHGGVVAAEPQTAAAAVEDSARTD